MTEREQFGRLNNVPYEMRKKKDPEEIRAWVQRQKNGTHWGLIISIIWIISGLLYWILADVGFEVLPLLLAGVWSLWLSFHQRRQLAHAESQIDAFLDYLDERIE